MVNRLVFVTGNEAKIKNAQIVLQKFGVEVEPVQMDIPELQSEYVAQVAEFSARYAGNLLNTTLIKIDVAFEIRALGGFPGPFIKYINQWLPPEKILKMMWGENDRFAQFIECICLYQPGQGCLTFSAATTGQIVECAKGENGWGIDQIFVPAGYSDSLASLSAQEREQVWNQSNWDQLGSYLQGL